MNDFPRPLHIIGVALRIFVYCRTRISVRKLKTMVDRHRR
jgi:hypothetical protein